MEAMDLPLCAPTLIESTRTIGYLLKSAVSNIVDNCIAASAQNIDIYFFPLDGAYGSGIDMWIRSQGDNIKVIKDVTV